MKNVPYSTEEKQVIGSYRVFETYAKAFEDMGMPVASMEVPKYNRPISPKENMKLLFSGKTPYWLPEYGMNNSEGLHFRPRQVKDNYATRNVFDGGEAITFPSYTEEGWFELIWEFVPVAGGATVHPGNPKIEDMNDWGKIIEMPNLDDIDWEEMRVMNQEYLGTDRLNVLAILDGHFERLMSLMDVEGAAIALIDEEQKEAVHRFFDKYSDFLDDLIGRVAEYCDIDMIVVQDDWGHQNGPFFSTEVAREMLLPYRKRLVESCHKRGLFYEQHSCGKNEAMIDLYIEAGIDLFCPQNINDFDYLLEKCKGSNLVIGLPDPLIAPGTTDEEVRKIATEWFEQYKDDRVVMFFFMPNPIFVETVYELSRKYYMDK